MNSPTFINRDKDQFQWKVYIAASFIHPPVKCDGCNGAGKHWSMMQYGDNNTCEECGGSGQKNRSEPMWNQQRIVDMLQKQLDHYLNNPEFLWEGAGI